MTDDHVAISGGPSFEQLLSGADEQFDYRSELLASILEYASAPPASASARFTTARQSGGHVAWLYSPSSTPATIAV